jgi:hypothetical protein
MLASRRLESGVNEWSTERGTLRTWSPAPTVYATQFTGHLDVRFVPHMVGLYDRSIVANERPRGFHDWQKMASYDTEARVKLTQWVLRMRDYVRSIDILVASRLVSMGVTVANVVLGGMIHVTRDRLEFEERLAEAVEAAQRHAGRARL